MGRLILVGAHLVPGGHIIETGWPREMQRAGDFIRPAGGRDNASRLWGRGVRGRVKEDLGIDLSALDRGTINDDMAAGVAKRLGVAPYIGVAVQPTCQPGVRLRSRWVSRSIMRFSTRAEAICRQVSATRDGEFRGRPRGRPFRCGFNRQPAKTKERLQ